VIGNNALRCNEYGKINDPSMLKVIANADKLDIVAPPLLLGKIETLMAKTTVKRAIW
jgi:hypothetical protein